MIRIHVLGAAGGVTGSCYIVETSKAHVMVDFGQFQGPDARGGSNLVMPPDIDRLSAVVLTHAHLDHSGRLPILCKNGYKGDIFATSASSDLTDAVLAEARAAGVPVLCYTVNDAAEAQALFDRGVSSIFSDTLLGRFP